MENSGPELSRDNTYSYLFWTAVDDGDNDEIDRLIYNGQDLTHKCGVTPL
jgi:hypothetical protein